MSDPEDKLRALLCCCAADHTVGEGGEHINVVQLDKGAEWPFMTMMNVLMPESKDYLLAAAVVCDRCIAEHREILYAVKGEPGPDGEAVYTRVPVSELKKPDIYWPDYHPDVTGKGFYGKLKWFADSPGAGAECVCSLCGEPIVELPIRLWDEEKGLEARLHIQCYNRFGQIVRWPTTYRMRSEMSDIGLSREHAQELISRVQALLGMTKEEAEVFVAGIEEGLADYRAGRMVRWAEVKRELRLEEE